MNKASKVLDKLIEAKGSPQQLSLFSWGELDAVLSYVGELNIREDEGVGIVEFKFIDGGWAALKYIKGNKTWRLPYSLMLNKSHGFTKHDIVRALESLLPKLTVEKIPFDEVSSMLRSTNVPIREAKEEDKDGNEIEPYEEESYKFDELSKEARRNALDHFRHHNVEFDDWADFILDYWKKEVLPTNGFEDAETAYSGFYSQGDGASFTASVNVEKYLELNDHLMELAIKYFPGIKESSYEQPDLFAPQYDTEFIGNVSARVERSSSQYSHENTIKGYVEAGYSKEDYEDWKIDDFIDEFEGAITEAARQLSKKLYRELEEEYEHLTSDEEVRQAILANEFKFNEYGEVL